MRDFQRQKVYDAESEWRLGMKNQKMEFPTLSLDEIERQAKFMLESRRIFKPVLIRDGRGHRRATAHDGLWATLTFPVWSRTLPIVIHEVAHIIGKDRHGPAFCRASLCLVRDYLGLTQASLLQTYYMKHRVVVSEAQEAHRNRKSQIEARLKISL